MTLDLGSVLILAVIVALVGGVDLWLHWRRK